MSAARTSSSDRAPCGARGRRAAPLGARTAGVLAALAALLASAVLTAQPPPSSPTTSAAARIVAVSDVHGAYDSLVPF